jgi:hypothetical protein
MHIRPRSRNYPRQVLCFSSVHVTCRCVNQVLPLHLHLLDRGYLKEHLLVHERGNLDLGKCVAFFMIISPDSRFTWNLVPKSHHAFPILCAEARSSFWCCEQFCKRLRHCSRYSISSSYLFTRLLIMSQDFQYNEKVCLKSNYMKIH